MRGLTGTLALLQAGLIAVPTWLFVSERHRLPERVVMQSDFAGRPTRYGSPDELYLLPMIMLLDWAMVGLVALIVARRPPHPRMAEHPQARELGAAWRGAMVRMTDWLILSMNGGIAALWLGMGIGVLPQYAWLARMAWPTFGVAMLACCAGVPAYWMRRIAPVTRAIYGHLDPPGEAARWRYGGMFYYAPDDPRSWVPKRVGIGYTPNFARGPAVALMALAVGLPLLLTLGAVLYAWLR